MKQLLTCFVLLLTAATPARAQMGANLCPVASATIAAGASGSWQDTATWRLKDMGGNWSIPATSPPTTGAMVYVPPGITVTNHATTADALWIHAAGTLTVCDHCDTQVNVHTLYVPMGGAVRVGGMGMPVTGKAVVEFLPGPFLPGDWQKLSRGLICHGEFTAAGVEKTAWDIVAADLPVGATSLQLLNVPLRWAVGDTILIAGTDSAVGENFTAHKYQSEQRTITAINGRTITWAEPLKYRHFRWRADLPFHCWNITRNVIFRSRSTTMIADRGHLMFMSSMNDMAYTARIGLGRTDKSQPVTDPRLDAYGEFIVGSDANPRARYADHVHRAGALSAPARRRGCVVDGSPGWGFLNHNSNVQYDDCIAVRCFGFGFGTEEGQERGHMRRCFAALNRGQGDTITSTDSDHGIDSIGDWGKDGSGFWLQGGLVEVSDCVSCDNSGRGFALFNRPLNSYPRYNGSTPPVPEYLRYPITVDASLLSSEYTPAGQAQPSSAVPQRVFSRNMAYGNKVGLQVWNATGFPDGLPPSIRGSVSDFATWGRGARCHLEYARQFNVDGLTVLGDMLFRPESHSFSKFDSALLLRLPEITVTRFDWSGMKKKLEDVGSATEKTTHVVSP